MEELRRLAEVSQQWRRTVLVTPELWSLVGCGMTEVQLKWALTRPKEALLDVDGLSDSGHFMQAIVPHSGTGDL